MASSFLSFKNAGFVYDGALDAVFENVRFTLGCGWTGIVGANGAGKTTLLRLALGQLKPTQGHVSMPGPGVWCPQRTDDEPPGLRDLLMAPGAAAEGLRRQLGLKTDWCKRWNTLSHGERKRAQLAVALAGDPVFLAVDEPTNHLDRDTRAVVWRALKGFGGIGLLVSHDRELLDDLCAQCLFLDPPRVTVRPGGYSEGAGQAQNERTALLRRLSKADREIDQLRRETDLRREQTAKGEHQRSKRGLGKHDHDAKARVNAARVADSGSGQRLRQLDGRAQQAVERRAELGVKRRFALGVTLSGEASHRRCLASLPEGEIALGETWRLRIPALSIRPGDRIGIEGPNGAGKSTLIRRIVADLETAREHVAYIPQEIDVSGSRAILETFRQLPPARLGKAMTLVRRLGSDPGRLLQSAEPSPGELRKLLLAACIESSPHIVILDEPTNHLDLPSTECLEEALDGCEAALVMVSHDRRFLDRLASRMWVVRHDGGQRWILEE